MKKLTGNKEQKIPIGDISDSYLLVNFDWEVARHPTTKEQGHGEHEINQDEVSYEIQMVSVFIVGVITSYYRNSELTNKQKSAIEQVLSIYE